MDALAASFPGSVVSHDESLRARVRAAPGGLSQAGLSRSARRTAQYRRRPKTWRRKPCCAPIAISIAFATANDFAGGSCASAFRLALDRIRAKGRRERHEHEATRATINAQREANVETLVASREFERQVALALDALPEKLRIVMVLAAIEGYNTREVAKLAGLPEGTVKSRLFLARKKLAESLQCLVKNTPVG